MKNLVDFHAHILPGVDHGSDSLETSLAQLDILKGFGIESVVATPHFYPHKENPDAFLSRRKIGSEKLGAAVPKGDIAIYLGAEVLVCPGLDRMEDLGRLCIEGTNVILLEMPFTKWNDALLEAVSNISQMDYTVVMAHVNRYPFEDVLRLLDRADVMVQLNAEGIVTMKGRKNLKRWLSLDYVAALGSDIHKRDKAAGQNFIKAVKKYATCAESIMEISHELLVGAKPL